MISDLQRLENVYPDEAAFFREYGVTTLLAAPFSKRINQGFIAVDDPTRYTDDPVFLFIASYAVVAELNEIKQQQSLLAATKASKYNPEDIHINFFGGMEIISSKGTLTGEDIKADQCYLLLAYLILNHKKNFSVDTLAEIICPYDELDSPYKVVNIDRPHGHMNEQGLQPQPQQRAKPQRFQRGLQVGKHGLRNVR